MEIYIFGAGASAAEGAPATQDFLVRAWELLGPEFDQRIRAVWRFLEAIFCVPVTGPDSFSRLPAVDEVISLVDWSLHENQGLGYHYDPARLFRVRRDLEHLLCATLDAALDSRSHQAHTRFVQNLITHSRHSPFALISLNYDTLLDSALSAAGLTPDYGLGERRPGPFLAKLHGSLNWGLCPACSQITVTRTPATAACSRCANRRLHGLIISPTLIKSYRGAHLQQIWAMAQACIQQAERIVFAGYSMPAADIAIYHLLQRGMLAAGEGRPRPAVHVINHTDPNWSAAERTLHEKGVTARFTRLFGPHVTFDFTGFHGQV